eukprot:1451582-Pyramimonas_sp.AAC.1
MPEPSRTRMGSAASLSLRSHARTELHPTRMCAHGMQSLGSLHAQMVAIGSLRLVVACICFGQVLRVAFARS